MPNNLFADIPLALPEELSDVLHRTDGVRIERIISLGQTSPPDFWYDQPEHEWVLLIQGAARLLIENLGQPQTVELRPGDYRFLPAHQRHRVEWTAQDEATIWLAVFFSA